jgi:uncharacterized delta-60 repeat protein
MCGRSTAALLTILASLIGVARAGTTGLDSTFGTGGIALLAPTPNTGTLMRRVSALLILSDGKMLIGGYVWDAANNVEMPAIGRLNENASWDTGFAEDGIFALPSTATAAPYGGRIDHLSVFSDGSVLAAGSQHALSNTLDYSSCTILVKLTSTGMLDTGFAPDKSGAFCFDFAAPPSNFSIHHHGDDVKVDSDDTFYLTTATTNIDYFDSAAAHFDANGDLVDAYGTHGIGLASLDVVATGELELLPDHQAIVVGVTGTPDSMGVGISRLGTDGTLDATYGTGGVAATDVQTSASVGIPHAALDGQSRLLITYYSYVPPAGYSPYRLARLTSTGVPDVTFNGNAQQPGQPGVVVLSLSSNPDADEILGAQPLPDGHILAVGQTAKVVEAPGVFNLSLLRLNHDASWDSSFGNAAHAGWTSLSIGGKDSSDTRPESLGLDSRDGKLIVGFGTNDANDNACLGLLRVIPDRLLDASFDEVPVMPTCPQ